MNIRTAIFMKGVQGADVIFEDGTPQIVFVGRSNVGKSSIINALVHQKDLARTSSFPGRTQQINIFLINKSFYLVDLPGYGFADVPGVLWQNIQQMIDWYLFESDYDFKKVILIIDAKVGPTENDMDMFYNLQAQERDIIIVANKIDKIKKSEYEKQIQKIQKAFEGRRVIPCSALKKTGIADLSGALLQ